MPAVSSEGEKGTVSKRYKGSKKSKERKETPWYVETPIVIVSTILIMLVLQTFIGRVYLIPSESMEPTLHGCNGCNGDRIAVEKITYYSHDPRPGDVIVFKGPDSWNTAGEMQKPKTGLARGFENFGSYLGLVSPNENDLVKRVIATGGQTVQCHKGDPSVMVDGKPTDQSFVKNPPQYEVDENIGSKACGGAYFGPLTVPDGNLFVMGDNRTNSADSRAHLGDNMQGTIPVDNVKGKVNAIILPFNRMGGVKSEDVQN